MRIAIVDGYEVSMDTEDFNNIFAKSSWRIQWSCCTPYVIQRGWGGQQLHRLIMDARRGETVRFKDGDTFNCRRKNLKHFRNDHTAINPKNGREIQTMKVVKDIHIRVDGPTDKQKERITHSGHIKTAGKYKAYAYVFFEGYRKRYTSSHAYKHKHEASADLEIELISWYGEIGTYNIRELEKIVQNSIDINLKAKFKKFME